jgi:transcriptional regulator with XRE-family HTH domain
MCKAFADIANIGHARIGRRRTENAVGTESDWTALPAITQAAAERDYGILLRTARVAAGLTLTQAGRLAGYSASTMSRLENHGRPVWNVKELRHLADVFAIPSDLLGLSQPTLDRPTTSLTTETQEGGEVMRRRDLLAGAAAFATGTAVLPVVPAASNHVTDTVADVILGRLKVDPIERRQLSSLIAAARADFRANRYTQLAQRLPRLLAQAAATRDAAPSDTRAGAHAQLAQAYNVATQLLLKLHDNGMAWATADRAGQAARASGQPLIEAESQRLTATVMRRTDHAAAAQQLMLDAAQQLDNATGLPDSAHGATYAQLLAAASYTAAIRDDRDTAWTLLDEAERATQRITSTGENAFNPLELAVYKISVSRALGDFGAAIGYARLVDPTTISTPERRSRYWEDTALALHGRGQPDAAFRALLAAERDSPEEVRFRPWAQQITRHLLTHTNRRPADVRMFANRIGAD